MVPEFLADGPYTVSNGDGGPDIGGFTADLGFHPMLDWTNAGAISEVDRTQELTITWTGGEVGREVVLIAGGSDDTVAGASASFVCTERVSEGSFAVPAHVLSSLPASTPWAFQGLPTGALFVGTAPISELGQFDAVGLDLGYFYYSSWRFKNAEFK